jgi:hypothetical protein
MFQCKFCERILTGKSGLGNHENYCKNNPDKKEKSDKWKLSMKNKKDSNSNQYTKAKELGLPKPEISEEGRKLIINASLNKPWSEERKLNHSKAMQLAVKNNPDSYTKNNVCGRVKIISHNGCNLKGSWELKTAVWLDSLDEEWQNEVNPQPYTFSGKTHMYYPDFYLPNRDVYIEVKGYKTARDGAKWSQFEGTLLIVDKKNIYDLESLSIEDLSAQ